MKEKYKIQDQIGRRFCRLLVISFVGRDGYRNKIFEVLCDCGNKKEVSLTNLISGGTVSCGCKRKDTPTNRKEKYYSSMWDLFRKYRIGAARRGYVFKLSLDKFKQITSGNCVYCGIEPNIINDNKNYNGFYRYNGIDRVDNNKGYEINNCVSCCGVCNKMKSTMSRNEFLGQIKRIMEFVK